MIKTTYRYEDLEDKTKEGILKELKNGLTVASVYFRQSLGFPFEHFNAKLSKMNLAEQLLWYMNFRNEHPNLFKNNNTLSKPSK